MLSPCFIWNTYGNRLLAASIVKPRWPIFLQDQNLLSQCCLPETELPLRNLWLLGREMTDTLQTGLPGTHTFLRTGKDDAMIVIENAIETMTEETVTDAIGPRLPEDEIRRTGIVDLHTEAHQDGMSIDFVHKPVFHLSTRYQSPRRGLYFYFS